MTNQFCCGIIANRELRNATLEEGEKMVNSDKLKGIMREKRMTQADAAKLLGLSECSVNQKINNVRPFFLDEAEKLANALEIRFRRFWRIFFCFVSCKTQH